MSRRPNFLGAYLATVTNQQDQYKNGYPNSTLYFHVPPRQGAVTQLLSLRGTCNTCQRYLEIYHENMIPSQSLMFNEILINVL